jgi:hypothetical protein
MDSVDKSFRRDPITFTSGKRSTPNTDEVEIRKLSTDVCECIHEYRTVFVLRSVSHHCDVLVWKTCIPFSNRMKSSVDAGMNN